MYQPVTSPPTFTLDPEQHAEVKYVHSQLATVISVSQNAPPLVYQDSLQQCPLIWKLRQELKSWKDGCFVRPCQVCNHGVPHQMDLDHPRLHQLDVFVTANWASQPKQGS